MIALSELCTKLFYRLNVAACDLPEVQPGTSPTVVRKIIPIVDNSVDIYLRRGRPAGASVDNYNRMLTARLQRRLLP